MELAEVPDFAVHGQALAVVECDARTETVGQTGCAALGGPDALQTPAGAKPDSSADIAASRALESSTMPQSRMSRTNSDREQNAEQASLELDAQADDKGQKDGVGRVVVDRVRVVRIHGTWQRKTEGAGLATFTLGQT